MVVSHEENEPVAIRSAASYPRIVGISDKASFFHALLMMPRKRYLNCLLYKLYSVVNEDIVAIVSE